MECTPLSELKRHDVNAVVHVSVVRMWDFRGLADGGPIQHVNMVLTDEKVCFMCTPPLQHIVSSGCYILCYSIRIT
jgi:hypothetical protein